MFNYIQASINGDLSALYAAKKRFNFKVDKSIEEEKLFELQCEFATILNGNDKSIYANKISMFRSLLKAQILESAIVIVKSGSDLSNNIRKILKKYGISVTGNKEQDIERMMSLHRKLKKEIQRAIEIEDKNTNKVPTFETYIEQLAIICSHYKFHTNIKSIDAGSFAAYCRRMKKESEEYEKIRKKIKGNK